MWLWSICVTGRAHESTRDTPSSTTKCVSRIEITISSPAAQQLRQSFFFFADKESE
jgi:hypothetical protein